MKTVGQRNRMEWRTIIAVELLLFGYLLGKGAVMGGQGKLALLRFRARDIECDRKTYAEYVRQTLSEQCTMDEVCELMGYS